MPNEIAFTLIGFVASLFLFSGVLFWTLRKDKEPEYLQRQRDMFERATVQFHCAERAVGGYSVKAVEEYDDVEPEPSPYLQAVKDENLFYQASTWDVPPYSSDWGNHPDEINMRTAPYTVAHCEEFPGDCKK